MDETIVDDWNEKLPAIIEGYPPCDILNMDETGIFFRQLPDRTLRIRGEECSGGKRSKDRLTVVMCASMTGTFEKTWVIGKAAKPRCFKNIDIRQLPVTWRANKKSWMTVKNGYRHSTVKCSVKTGK